MWRYLVLLMVAAHSLIQRLQDHASSRRQKLVPPTNRYLPITHCKFRLAAPNLAWTFFAVLWFRTPQTKKDYISSSRSSKLNQVFTFPLTNGHPSHVMTMGGVQSEVAALFKSFLYPDDHARPLLTHVSLISLCRGIQPRRGWHGGRR